MAMFLFDTHLHIDLYQDYQKIIDEIEINSIYTIFVTNAPSVFKKACEITRASKYIKPALGFHPGLVKQRFNEIGLFSELINETKYIGEIGLDYSKVTDSDKDIQRRAFKKILQLCSSNPRKVLTIHSRRAIEDVLDLLGKNFPGITILHWFSGSASALKKALDYGCYFSVNFAMLSSESGQRIVAEIPLDKLFLESDGPFVTIDNRPIRPLDNSLTLKKVAEVKRISLEKAQTVVWENSKQLIETKLGK